MKISYTTRAPDHVSWGVVASPIGKLAVGVTAKGQICRLSFLRGAVADAMAEKVAQWQKEWPRTIFARGAAVKDIAHYPLLLAGTDFQQSVWRAMAKIPAGQTASYGELAQRIGKPKAARAVGAACGANPVLYLIPCHRVLAANGALGGFSSGLDIKRKLLKLEKSAV